MRIATVSLMVSLLAATACSGKNPQYCAVSAECTDSATPVCVGGECAACSEGVLGDTACVERDPATPACFAGACVACNSNVECPLATPTCSEHQCLGCVDHSDCTAAAPTCDGTNCGSCASGETGDAVCSLYEDDGTPYCGGNGSCAQCRDRDDCIDPARSVCDEDDYVCRGCEDHDECPSLVCDRDSGSCVEEDSIIYADVNAGTDGVECGDRMTPCKTIGEVDGALSQVTNLRFHIRLLPGIYPEAVYVGDENVVVVGDAQSIINPAGLGFDGLAVGVGGNLRVEGLTVQGADATYAGVACTDAEVAVWGVLLQNNDQGFDASGCTVSLGSSSFLNNDGRAVFLQSSTATIDHCTASGNGSAGYYLIDDSVGTITDSSSINNGQYGAFIAFSDITLRRSVLGLSEHGIHVRSSDHIIANNIVYVTDVGLELIGDGATPVNQFLFNTVIDSAVRGAECSGGLATGNIIRGLSSAAIVTGPCTWTYNNIEGIAGDLGPTNIDAVPIFVDPAAADFHLQAGDPNIDAADPNATLEVDIDGHARPQGLRHDIGADEYVAP